MIPSLTCTQRLRYQKLPQCRPKCVPGQKRHESPRRRAKHYNYGAKIKLSLVLEPSPLLGFSWKQSKIYYTHLTSRMRVLRWRYVFHGKVLSFSQRSCHEPKVYKCVPSSFLRRVLFGGRARRRPELQIDNVPNLNLEVCSHSTRSSPCTNCVFCNRQEVYLMPHDFGNDFGKIMLRPSPGSVADTG